MSQEVKPEGGKSVATLVEQMKGPPVTAGEVVTWEARLKIPGGIPPSNLGNVLSYPVVIHVYYFLHVRYDTEIFKSLNSFSKIVDILNNFDSVNRSN